MARFPARNCKSSRISTCDAAILAAKDRHAVAPQGFEELAGELLGGEIDGRRAAARLPLGRPDPFQEMRLADARGTVDEQRRDLPRVAGDHLGGIHGQPVAGADDEGRERGELPRREGGGGRWLRLLGHSAGVGRFAHFRRSRRIVFAVAVEAKPSLLHLTASTADNRRRLGGAAGHRIGRTAALAGSLDTELQRRTPAEDCQAGILHRRAEVRTNPIEEELVRRPDREDMAVPIDPRARSEPQFESFFSDLVGQCGKQGRHDVHIVPGQFRITPARALPYRLNRRPGNVALSSRSGKTHWLCDGRCRLGSCFPDKTAAFPVLPRKPSVLSGLQSCHSTA